MYISWNRLVELFADRMPNVRQVDIRYSGEVLNLRPKKDEDDPDEVIQIESKMLVQNFSIGIPDGTFRDEFFKLLGETHQLILREVGPMAPRNTEENFEFQLWDRNGESIA